MYWFRILHPISISQHYNAFYNIIKYLIVLISNLLVWRDSAPERLLSGLDFRGEVCGQGRLKSKPYLYYPTPIYDARIGMCVEKCPENTGKELYLYDTDIQNTPITEL